MPPVFRNRSLKYRIIGMWDHLDQVWGGGDVKWQISFGAVVLWDSAMYITKRNLELRQLTAVPV